MCVVSMIGDEFTDRWSKPYCPTTIPASAPMPAVITWDLATVSRTEFEALKKEVELLKSLLIRAKLYDEENGEPDCEMDDKVALIKKVAEAVGVDMDEIFGNK